MSKGLNVRIADDVHKIIRDYQEAEGLESRDDAVEGIVRAWAGKEKVAKKGKQ